MGKQKKTATKKAKNEVGFGLTANDTQSSGHSTEEVYAKTLAAHEALSQVEGDGTLATVIGLDDTGAAKAVVVDGANALHAAHMDRARFFRSLGEHVDANEELSKLNDELSEKHRIVVLMHDSEGYKLKEIQEITGDPIGTLKSRLHRARARLRELLSAGGTF